jgi:hypothetical protein
VAEVGCFTFWPTILGVVGPGVLAKPVEQFDNRQFIERDRCSSSRRADDSVIIH